MTPVSSSGSGSGTEQCTLSFWVFAPLYLCWFSNGGEPFQISGGNEIRCKPEAAFTITQARESVKSILARFPKMARSLLPTACEVATEGTSAWHVPGGMTCAGRHDMCRET